MHFSSSDSNMCEKPLPYCFAHGSLLSLKNEQYPEKVFLIVVTIWKKWSALSTCIDANKLKAIILEQSILIDLSECNLILVINNCQCYKYGWANIYFSVRSNNSHSVLCSDSEYGLHTLPCVSLNILEGEIWKFGVKLNYVKFDFINS